MKSSVESQVNVPGIVERIPAFSFSIPVMLSKKVGGEKVSDDVLKAHADDIVRSSVEKYISPEDHRIDYEIVKPVFGAGDFLVTIYVHKKPTRVKRIDYFQAIIDTVKEVGAKSQALGMRTAKKFLVEDHYVDVPRLAA